MPPRLARLLAVVVAAALVAGAFVLRGAMADDDDGPVVAGAGGRGDDGDDGGGGPYTILCDADLGEAACAALREIDKVDEVEVRSWREVRSAAPEDLVRFDAWLTLDPLPAVLDAARRFASAPQATSGDAVEVASSTLALLTFGDSKLECPSPAGWDCLVEPVRPGVAVPSPETSVGVIVLAAGAAALLDDTAFGIDQVRDAPAGDALEDLLDEVETAAGTTTSDQTASMLNPGTASGAVTFAGLAEARAGTPQGQGRDLRTVALRPEVTVGVVLVGLGPGGPGAVAALREHVTEQTVLDALSEVGWEGEPAGTRGLPDPDVVDALQEELG